MIISEEEANSRLNSSKNLATVLPLGHSGRTTGTKNVPVETKKLGAVMSVALGPTETARQLGMSISQASNYGNGEIINNKPDEELTDVVNKARNRVQKTAIDKMMEAFGLMTPDKMDKSSAKDLSAIAANMSRIVRDTTPQSSGGTAVNVVIYAPEQKKESAYKVIEE